jgi:hypothetical protein
MHGVVLLRGRNNVTVVETEPFEYSNIMETCFVKHELKIDVACAERQAFALFLGRGVVSALAFADSQGIESFQGARPDAASMQLDARLQPMPDYAGKCVERNAHIAMDRNMVQFVQRHVHPARDQPLHQQASTNQPTHQIADRGQFSQRDK